MIQTSRVDLKKGMTMLHQIQNTDKEGVILRKNQMKNLQLKRTISEVKIH